MCSPCCQVSEKYGEEDEWDWCGSWVPSNHSSIGSLIKTQQSRLWRTTPSEQFDRVKKTFEAGIKVSNPVPSHQHSQCWLCTGGLLPSAWQWVLVCPSAGQSTVMFAPFSAWMNEWEWKAVHPTPLPERKEAFLVVYFIVLFLDRFWKL